MTDKTYYVVARDTGGSAVVLKIAKGVKALWEIKKVYHSPIHKEGKTYFFAANVITDNNKDAIKKTFEEL